MINMGRSEFTKVPEPFGIMTWMGVKRKRPQVCFVPLIRMLKLVRRFQKLQLLLRLVDWDMPILEGDHWDPKMGFPWALLVQSTVRTL